MNNTRTHKARTLTALFALGAVGTLVAARPAAAQDVFGGKLPTRWAKLVSPTNALPDYPRPQMTRTRWQSLNGTWSYALTDGDATTPPTAFGGGKILVPFPYEAPLSGVGKASPITQRLWYRRTFTVPAAWKGQRVLLHFGAVNWDSTVSVNGQSLGRHKGGFDGFEYDVTKDLKPGDNELVVSAFNPMSYDVPNGQVVGKQRPHSGSIFYTGATGIWQSVWLEPVPTASITSLKITPDIDAKELKLTVDTYANSGAKVVVTAMDNGKKIASGTGRPGTMITLPIKTPHLWTPTDPHLYTLRVSLSGGDSVDSYFAMRKISLGKDAQGRTRPMLNNKYVFQVGALDQGYWPDGIYTAPTDDALKSDIVTAKQLGFNLLRKHAKVEPERWYYWTDKLGMLVWQDMPQAFGKLNDDAKAQWMTEWKSEVTQFYNHPSIIVWTTFNEGMGEDTFDVPAVVALTKQMDPTRLVNNASGWTDKGVGDFDDVHDYPGPGSHAPSATRAAVNGEFGGITQRVDGHMLFSGNVMGYGKTLSEGWKTTRNYQGLLQKAYDLNKNQGTSAVVYTQLTDVEQEINGLLTYDRAVVKVNPAIVSAANNGRFPAMPPNPNPDTSLVPTSEDVPQTWAYTTAKPADDWTATAFNESAWKTGPAPFGHDVGGVNTNWSDTPGDIWMRRTVTLPQNIPAKLNVLARHDEDVEIYINGVLAASATGYTDEYVALPMTDAARAALKPGKNVIAVHCHQTTGGQSVDVGIVEAK